MHPCDALGPRGVDRVLHDGDAVALEAELVDALGRPLGVGEPPVRPGRVGALPLLRDPRERAVAGLQVRAVAPERDAGTARGLPREERVVGEHAVGLLDDDEVGAGGEANDRLVHRAQPAGAHDVEVDGAGPGQREPQLRRLGVVGRPPVEEGERDVLRGERLAQVGEERDPVVRDRLLHDRDAVLALGHPLLPARCV